MHTFKQLPLEINNYINDFVIEQTARENFKNIVKEIQIFGEKKQKADLFSNIIILTINNFTNIYNHFKNSNINLNN